MRADISIGTSDYRVEGTSRLTRADLEREFAGSGWPLPPLGDASSLSMRTGDRIGPASPPDVLSMPFLLVGGGLDAGRCLYLPPGASTIGRGADCTHQLADPDVSRTQFTVDVGPRAITIRDVATTHRSALNGEPMRGARSLRPGDRLRVGTTVLEWPGRSGDVSKGRPDRLEQPALPPRSRSVAGMLAALVPVAVTGVAVAVVGSSRMMVMALATSLAMCAALLFGRSPRGGRRERRAYRKRRAEFEAALAAACHHEAHERRRSDPGPDLDELCARDMSTRTRVRIGLGQARAAVTITGATNPETHPRLDDVPILVAIEHPGVALCAPAPIARGQARWLLLQLAASHPPAALRIALNLDRRSETEWRWARWLPHLGNVRVGGDMRVERPGTATLTVVVHDSDEPLPPLPDARVIAIGAAVLPVRATIADDTGVRQILSEQETTVTFDADVVTVDFAEAAARRLAGQAAGAATNSPGGHLLDLHGMPVMPLPSDIVDLWALSDGTVATPLGAGANGIVSFDVDKDGPHALIGGTTGSGKSQLLQTLVLGLAVRYAPEVAQFLLVDYKGGAAFGACNALPHTAGVLTDLDARLTTRALRSLSAELRRRERLLAAAGVADIRQYHDATAPVPRLVVVVDEFATLAAELPDFVRGLVGIAQRGRSLGMHLILATQRPGGSVSPDIRANSNLRIALRTINASESIDLIDTAAAADLDPGRPGQAIRADAPAQPFQVAHFGRRTAPDELRITPLDEWGQPATEPTTTEDVLDMRALVDVLVAAATCRAMPAPPPPWLEPLPDVIHELPASARQVPIGLLDLPDEQRRAVAFLDLAQGSTTVIAGGPRSGRTSALLNAAGSAATRYAPSQLHIHALDFAGGGLAELTVLPHLGTLATTTQSPAVAAALIARLLTTPRDSCDHTTLLLIDGWSSLCQALDAHDLGSSTARLGELLARAGRSRLTAVICGDRSVLTAKLAAVTDERFVLRCSDPADYSLAGIAVRDVPSHLPPGRALRARDAAEIQFVHGIFPPVAVAGTPDSHAIRVRELPSRPDPASIPRRPGHVCLGLGGDGAEPVWLPLNQPAQLLVAGPARSGKTALLCVLLTQFEPGQVAVAAPSGSTLHRLAASLGHRLLEPGEDVIPDLDWVLVDDADQFVDTPLGRPLSAWAESAEKSMIIAAATDRVSSAFRGPAAVAKRWRRGILLQPGLVDGELLGVRLDRTDVGGGPGRGIAVPDPSWGWPRSAVRADRTPVQTFEPGPL